MDESVLVNYLRKQCSEDENKLVERWYEESPENKKLLQDIYYTLTIGDVSKTMNSSDTEKSLREFKVIVNEQVIKNRSKNIFHNWRRIASIVAAFIAGIIVMGTTVTYINQNNASYTIVTESGQRAQTILPDGSKVWLNSSTELTYKTSLWSGKREVNLLGEAYFEVAHNKSLFEVNSKNIKTSVLGTKFNIRARENEKRVVTTLFEGSVRINPELKKDKEYILIPGQTLDVNTESYAANLTEYEQPNEVLLWIKGRLIFHQLSLLEITNLFEKLYDVKFVFEDESIKQKRFTGNFSTDNTPEEMFRILKLTNHFNFKKEGENIYISK